MGRVGDMCIAIGCNNRAAKKDSTGKRISMHRFPKDPELKKKWIHAIHRKDWTPTVHSRICSEHFKESDFDNDSPFRRFLKKNSIPSIFAAIPKLLQPSPSASGGRRSTKRALSPIPPTKQEVMENATQTYFPETSPPLHLQPIPSNSGEHDLKRTLSPIPPSIPEISPKPELELISDELEKTNQCTLLPIPTQIPLRQPKSELELTKEELASTKQKLIESRLKLKNMRARNKRLEVKVAKMQIIIRTFKKSKRILDEMAERT